MTDRTGVLCPTCGQAGLVEIVIPEYETKVMTFPCVIKNAKFAECPKCGERLYDAKELKRWEKNMIEQYKAKGVTITRQTLSNWSPGVREHRKKLREE